MKRWIWWIGVVITIGVIFVGFGYTKKRETQKQFESLMIQAKNSVEHTNYKKAKIYLQDALKKKNDSEQAEKQLNQLEIYCLGLNEFRERNYYQSLKKYEEVSTVSDALTILNKRASKKVKLLKKILKKQKKYEEMYKEAIKLTELGRYIDSNYNLAMILNSKEINQEYYQEFRKQAIELRTRNYNVLEQLRIEQAQRLKNNNQRKTEKSSQQKIPNTMDKTVEDNNKMNDTKIADVTSEKKDLDQGSKDTNDVQETKIDIDIGNNEK